jgi:hypothetical protein
MKTKNNLHADEPPSGYSPLEKIISENYFDSAEIIVTIRKYHFETTLSPSLQKISYYIKSNKYHAIPNIVGTLLVSINDKIQLAEGKEKRILEGLSSTLFTEQIAHLNATKSGRECWDKCIPVLKDTCDFKNYNYEELSKLLKLDFIPIDNSKKKVNRPLPYYKWMGNETDLIEIIRDIQSKKWISKVSEFRKLFKPVSDENYVFNASSEHIDKLIILFDELKTQQLIIPQKNKGHFYPLNRYGLDFDQKLFKKEPKKYVESIKSKKPYYESIQKEVQKLIDSNCS